MDTTLSKEDRIFQLDDDLFLVYTGNLQEEPRPFVRVGPAPLFAVDLNRLVEHNIIAQMEPGNLGRERLLANYLYTYLDHPFSILKPEDLTINYLADKNFLRRLFQLLEFSPNNQLQLPEPYDQFDPYQTEQPQVESQSFSNGNIRINMGNRNLLDYEKIAKRRLTTAQIWTHLASATQKARNTRGQVPTFYEGGPFGAIFEPEQTGFIVPGLGSGPEPARFLSEENQKLLHLMPPGNPNSARNLALNFFHRGEVIGVNPEKDEHFGMYARGLDVHNYNTCLVSSTDSEGLYNFLTYHHHASQKRLEGKSEPNKVQLFLSSEDKEGLIKSIYAGPKIQFIRDTQNIFRQTPAVFYHNSDQSLGLLQFTLSSGRKVTTVFPLKEGNHFTSFDIDERRYDVQVLPYKPDGHSDPNPGLLLYLPKEASYDVEELSLKERWNRGVERVGDRLEGDGLFTQHGVHPLEPGTKYVFADPATGKELGEFVASFFVREELDNTFTEAIRKAVARTENEALYSLGEEIKRVKRTLNEVERANLAEVIRLLANRVAALKDEELEAYFQKLQKDWGHRETERFSELYRQIKGKTNSGNTVKLREDGDIIEKIAGKYELVNTILALSDQGTYLLRSFAERHIEGLPRSIPEQETQDRNHEKRLKNQAERYADNLEKRDIRLSEYLKLYDRLEESHKSIAGDRLRLRKFLNQTGLVDRLIFFRRRPRNQAEKWWFGFKDWLSDANDWLGQFPPFSSLEPFFKERTGKNWFFSLLSATGLALAAIGVVLLTVFWPFAPPEQASNTTGTATATAGLTGMSETAKKEILANAELAKLLAGADTKNILAGGQTLDSVLLSEVYQYAMQLTAMNGYAAPGKPVSEGQKNPDLIYPGEKLTLPTGGKVSVGEKETIWQISTRKYIKALAEVQKLRTDDADNKTDKLTELSVTPGLKRLAAAPE